MYITKLPLDYSRCSNYKCSKKENCLRWLDRHNGRLATSYNEINCKEQIKPKNSK